LGEITSGWVGFTLDWLLRYAKLPSRVPLLGGISSLAGAAALFVSAGYVLAFPMYAIVRRLTMRTDLRKYRGLTGTAPTTFWKTPPPVEKAPPREAEE